MRHTRSWDPSLNDGAGAWRFTHAGRLYHGRERFIVEVPVDVNYVDPHTRRVRTTTQRMAPPRRCR